MKSTATLTSKGQVTIPLAVRRKLGLETGDSIVFECREGSAEVRPLRGRLTSFGVLNKFLPQGWQPPTVAEMNAGIAKNLAQKHARLNRK